MKWFFVAVVVAVFVGCSGTPDSPGGQIDSQAEPSKEAHMRIGLSSVFVEDQAGALRFFTQKFWVS